jgi:WD40 repeat protein
VFERELASGTALFAATLSPDGRRAVALHEGATTADLLDAERGGRIAVLTPPHGTQAVLARFAPDSSLVAIATGGVVLPVYDTTAGALRFEVEHGAQTLACTWSRDGAHLASADMAGEVVLSDRTGRRVRSFRVDDSVAALEFHPSGELLALATVDGRVVVVEVAGGRELASMALGTPAYELHFSPDGAVLAVSGRDQEALLWALAPFAGPAEALARRMRCAVPFRLDAAGGLEAVDTDVTACERP